MKQLYAKDLTKKAFEIHKILKLNCELSNNFRFDRCVC